jgi:hypothetical protein
MTAVLSVALVCGLLGFALHFLWVVAIIVMALGLGFANSRRDPHRCCEPTRRTAVRP